MAAVHWGHLPPRPNRKKNKGVSNRLSRKERSWHILSLAWKIQLGCTLIRNTGVNVSNNTAPKPRNTVFSTLASIYVLHALTQLIRGPGTSVISVSVTSSTFISRSDSALSQSSIVPSSLADLHIFCRVESLIHVPGMRVSYGLNKCCAQVHLHTYVVRSSSKVS